MSYAKGGKSVLTMKQAVWKNTLNFEKDAPMTHANFITNVIILTEKKKQEALFF